MDANSLKFRRIDTDRARVSLAGEHDQYSAERIARCIRDLLDEGYDVQVDLKKATFVDSTTVAVLIEAHRYAKEHGRRLAVVIGETTGWAVRRLFELTYLDSVLTVLSDG